MAFSFEILVKAADQASDIIKRVDKELDKLGNKTAPASGSKFKQSLGLIKGSVMETYGPMLTLAGGVTLVGGAVAATAGFVASGVKEWVAYNEEVSKLSTTTSVGTEDLSRMMQAADDLGIEMGSLKTAFEFASKNGVQPTIENIAELGSRMTRMTDVTARNEEMARIFGRGWADASRFLLQSGDAIREQTSAVNDGLVVTEDSAEAAREYAASMDDLNDSVTIVKNNMAKGLVPELNKVLEVTNKIIEANMEFADGQDLVNKAFEEGNITAEQAAVIYGELQDNYEMTAEEVQGLIEKETFLNGVTEMMTGAFEGAATAVGDETRAFEQAIPAMGYYASQAGAAEAATKKLEDAAKGAGKGVQFLFDQLDTDITGDIAKSLDQITYKLNFGDVINNSYLLAKEKIKQNQVTPQEGMEIMNGLFVAAEALKVKGGEIDFSEAGRNIADNLGMPLSDAVAWLQKLISKDGAKMNYTAILNILYAGAGRQYEPYRAGAGKSKTEDSGSGPKGASGLDMIVPGGYPMDSFPVWAQSGERVTITPASEMKRGGEGRGKERSATYVLNIHTNAAVEPIVRDFNMLRAFAR